MHENISREMIQYREHELMFSKGEENIIIWHSSAQKSPIKHPMAKKTKKSDPSQKGKSIKDKSWYFYYYDDFYDYYFDYYYDYYLPTIQM